MYSLVNTSIPISVWCSLYSFSTTLSSPSVAFQNEATTQVRPQRIRINLRPGRKDGLGRDGRGQATIDERKWWKFVWL